jgi:hypothetical protein
MRDSWTIILYREDCPKCRSSIRNGDRYDRVAFVLAPPYHNNQNRIGTEKTRWLQLDEQREWFVAVPTILTLRDGIVISVEAK